MQSNCIRITAWDHSIPGTITIIDGYPDYGFMDVKLCQKAHLTNVKTWMMRLPVLGHNSGIAATILFIAIVQQIHTMYA